VPTTNSAKNTPTVSTDKEVEDMLKELGKVIDDNSNSGDAMDLT